MHIPPSGPVKPRVHLQSLAALLLGDEVELEGQLIQALDDTAPGAVEYVPLMHSVQFPKPNEALYFPGLQLTHSQPFVCQLASNPGLVALTSEVSST